MPASKTVTLAANVAQTLVMTTARSGVTIINLSPTLGPVWYRLDGTDPVVEGDDSFPCFGREFIPNPGFANANGNLEVRVISATANRVSAFGAPKWKAT